LFYIVVSSYLFIPIGFFAFGKGLKDRLPLILGIYGIIFFTFIACYNYFPRDREIRKLVQLFYTFLEYVFFAVIFWINIKNDRFRKIIVTLSFLFLFFLVFYFFRIKLVRLDSVPIAIETILVLIYITYFFYETFKKSTEFYIYNHYCFWLSIGILIYLGGSFFFYILINDLSAEEVKSFGNVTYVAEIIKNVLFSVAVYVYYKNPISKISRSNSRVPYLDIN